VSSSRQLPSAAPLFGRYLDLRSLGGRRRGVVKCIFHEDRLPSLSIDLDRGLFNCFGCHAQGGVFKFAKLVGAAVPGVRPIEELSPLEIAQQMVRDRTRRYGRWAGWFYANGSVRMRTQMVDEARRTATTLGPDHPKVWDLLALAAQVERVAYVMEMPLDALLAGGRLHPEDLEPVGPLPQEAEA
jgi:hypothetical protein